MFYFLDVNSDVQNGQMNPASTLLYWGFVIVACCLMFYFMSRKQRKQQKKQQELIASIAIGDSVLTIAGFYGTVIDVVNDEVIIVEFGNNKNCRIPMRKSSVMEVEKQMEEEAKAK